MKFPIKQFINLGIGILCAQTQLKFCLSVENDCTFQLAAMCGPHSLFNVYALPSSLYKVLELRIIDIDDPKVLD